MLQGPRRRAPSCPDKLWRGPTLVFPRGWDCHPSLLYLGISHVISNHGKGSGGCYGWHLPLSWGRLCPGLQQGLGTSVLLMLNRAEGREQLLLLPVPVLSKGHPELWVPVGCGGHRGFRLAHGRAVLGSPFCITGGGWLLQQLCPAGRLALRWQIPDRHASSWRLGAFWPASCPDGAGPCLQKGHPGLPWGISCCFPAAGSRGAWPIACAAKRWQCLTETRRSTAAKAAFPGSAGAAGRVPPAPAPARFSSGLCLGRWARQHHCQCLRFKTHCFSVPWAHGAAPCLLQCFGMIGISCQKGLNAPGTGLCLEVTVSWRCL